MCGGGMRGDLSVGPTNLSEQDQEGRGV
jgi:hypothetical protein